MGLKEKARVRATFSRMGNPLSSRGALYHVGPTGRVQLFHELYRNQVLLVQGTVSPLEDAVLEVLAEQKKRELDADLRTQGVPPRLEKLLHSRRKAEQQRIISAEPLTGADFHAMAFNADTLGYLHQSDTYEFIPEHLEPKSDEHDAFFERHEHNSRFFRKLIAGFKERKHVTFHLLRERNGTYWHCFYFTLRDMFGDPGSGTSHWKGGHHVHYVSRSFVDEDADAFVAKFRTGDWKFPSEHVTWKDR